MKVVQEFVIFKKTEGVKYPGEHWGDTFKTERAAIAALDKSFGRKDFRVVRITYEAVSR